MANIIFGVAGEGMGHAIRCYSLIKHLRKRHKVKVFAGNRAYDMLSKKLEDINRIESQNIIYRHNRVAVLSTFFHNLKKFGKFLKSYKDVRKAINDFKADVVISDYEAVTNYASWFSGCRSYQINNQSGITFKRGRPSMKELPSFIFLVIVNFLFTVGAERILIYSIRPGKDTRRRVYLGNIIQEKILKHKHSYGNHILVYQTSDTNHRLINVLKRRNEKFIIYGFNIDREVQNLTFRKFNDTVFFDDFCSCAAMIANGGLTTITEGIYMKKPILSIPVEDQFEQIFNAKTIHNMGFGIYLKESSTEGIDIFMSNLEKYKRNLRDYKGMTNKEIFTKVEKTILKKKSP